MASTKKKNNPYQLDVHSDFSGGLNVDSAPDNLADNQLEVVENFDFDYRGAITQRLGCEKVNALPYPNVVHKIIELVRTNESVYYLAVIGNSLYSLDSTTWAPTLVQTFDSPDIGYFTFSGTLYVTGTVGGEDYYWTYMLPPNPRLLDVIPTNNCNLTAVKKCRKFVWNHQNSRIYACSNKSYNLFYSEPNDPQYFLETSRLVPTTADGYIQTIIPFSSGLVVVFDNTVWAWQGIDPATDAVWKKLPLTHGTLSSYSVCATPSSLTMLSEGGLHALNPAILDNDLMILSNEEMSINMAENKVMKILKGIVHPSTVVSVYDTINRRYLMAYGDDPNDPNNNKILVLNWPLKSFAIYTGIPVNDFCRTRNGDILIAAGNYILKMNSGYNDVNPTTGEPVAINAKMRSKQWSMGSPHYQKKTNKLFLSAVQHETGDSTVDLGVISGYKSVSYPGVLLDESFSWGEDWGRVWGWSDVISKEMRCRLRGQRFQFVCEHNVLNEPLSILGLAFNYKLSRPKGVKINGTAQKNVLS
jgi:hypothetical protein